MKIIFLNQTFHPDVMASGQYLTELALRLVEQGHQVTVITSRRAYDNPALCFPKHETWRGVEIIRVASTSFGKSAAWRRAADFASFILACLFRLAFLPRHQTVVALTTPPLISFIGAALARLWRARFVYWILDLNPDEAIAAGWLRAGSLAARVLEAMSRYSLRRAEKIIALDHFMRDRILAKNINKEKVAVIPPWSNDDQVRFDMAARDRFRKAHGLEDKFVVMYSGNHSPVHPLDTLLAAADQLGNDPGIVFYFVGGGSEWRKIRTRNSDAPSTVLRPPSTDAPSSVIRHPSSCSPVVSSPVVRVPPPSSVPNPTASSLQSPVSSLPNTTCLPYQPLDQLSASLSAADLHVVVMGNAMVGLVHPCKIYNILTVGSPVLYIGPERSHVAEILERAGTRQMWGAARHGEVDKVVAHIQLIRRANLQRTGKELADLAAQYSKEESLPRLVGLTAD